MPYPSKVNAHYLVDYYVPPWLVYHYMTAKLWAVTILQFPCQLTEKCSTQIPSTRAFQSSLPPISPMIHFYFWFILMIYVLFSGILANFKKVILKKTWNWSKKLRLEERRACCFLFSQLVGRLTSRLLVELLIDTRDSFYAIEWF